MSTCRRATRNASRPLFAETNADAAGIDVHSEEHWAALPPGRADDTVRRFGATTRELHKLADWLLSHGIKTVAMESTGVYWIPLFQMLEARGFDVFLVNARHVRNVPGRPKTDCLDCQWLQKLHSAGLLTASFRPDDASCRLRSVLRHRAVLGRELARHIQRMHKALAEMNVLLHKVISDVTGKTGMAIIVAILEGRRDFAAMARDLRDPQIKASPDEIEEALEGDYREEHLFVLRQELAMYRFIEVQMAECDREAEGMLQRMERDAPPAPPLSMPLTGAEKRRGRAPAFDVQSHLHLLTGTDLTRIPGLGAQTALELVAETGVDMGRWRSPEAFCAWTTLAPNPAISAGQAKGQRRPGRGAKVRRLFRQAAMTLRRSPTALGAFFRRICARCGGRAAVNATAHKLARIYYLMMHGRCEYKELGANYYDQKHHDRVMRQMKAKAARYGFTLVPAVAANA